MTWWHKCERIGTCFVYEDKILYDRYECITWFIVWIQKYAIVNKIDLQCDCLFVFVIFMCQRN